MLQRPEDVLLYNILYIGLMLSKNAYATSYTTVARGKSLRTITSIGQKPGQ